MAAVLIGAQQAVIQLATGQVWALDPPDAATLVRCVSGRCWLTQAGDSADHDLRAGDERLLQARGRVVVQAISPTELQVCAAHLAARVA